MHSNMFTTLRLAFKLLILLLLLNISLSQNNNDEASTATTDRRRMSPLAFIPDHSNGLFVIGQAVCQDNTIGITVYHYTSNIGPSQQSEPDWTVPLCPPPNMLYDFASADYSQREEELYIGYYLTRAIRVDNSTEIIRTYVLRSVSLSSGEGSEPLLQVPRTLAFPGIVKAFSSSDDSLPTLLYILGTRRLIQVYANRFDQNETTSRIYPFNEGNYARAMEIVENNVVVVGLHTPNTTVTPENINTFGNHIATVPLPGTDFRWNGELLNPSTEMQTVYQKRVSVGDSRGGSRNTAVLELMNSPISNCGSYTFVFLESVNREHRLEIDIHQYQSEPFSKVNQGTVQVPGQDTLVSVGCLAGGEGNGLLALLFQKGRDGRYFLMVDSNLVQLEGNIQESDATLFTAGTSVAFHRLNFDYTESLGEDNAPFGMVSAQSSAINEFVEYLDGSMESGGSSDGSKGDGGDSLSEEEDGLSTSLLVALGVSIPLLLLAILALGLAYHLRSRTSFQDNPQKAFHSSPNFADSKTSTPDKAFGNDEYYGRRRESMQISSPVLLSSSLMDSSGQVMKPIDHTIFKQNQEVSSSHQHHLATNSPQAEYFNNDRESGEKWTHMAVDVERRRVEAENEEKIGREQLQSLIDELNYPPRTSLNNSVYNDANISGLDSEGNQIDMRSLSRSVTTHNRTSHNGSTYSANANNNSLNRSKPPNPFTDPPVPPSTEPPSNPFTDPPTQRQYNSLGRKYSWATNKRSTRHSLTSQHSAPAATTTTTTSNITYNNPPRPTLPPPAPPTNYSTLNKAHSVDNLYNNRTEQSIVNNPILFGYNNHNNIQQETTITPSHLQSPTINNIDRIYGGGVEGYNNNDHDDEGCERVVNQGEFINHGDHDCENYVGYEYNRDLYSGGGYEQQQQQQRQRLSDGSLNSSDGILSMYT